VLLGFLLGTTYPAKLPEFANQAPGKRFLLKAARRA
jgi:hypothetical protein